MKRDMDLIRLILLELENSEPYQIFRPDICGYQDKEINYHLELLLSAWLVEGEMHYTAGMTANPNVKLTWAGHEFLDDIRSDTIWTKTKTFLSSKDVTTVSVEVLKTVVQDVVKNQLGLN